MFRNGEVALFYKNRVNAGFANLSLNRTYSANVAAYNIKPQIIFSNSLLYPTPRLWVDGVVMTCAWMISLTGDFVFSECEVRLTGNVGDMVTVIVEAYLPPNHVVKSAYVTLVFGTLNTLIIRHFLTLTLP